MKIRYNIDIGSFSDKGDAEWFAKRVGGQAFINAASVWSINIVTAEIDHATMERQVVHALDRIGHWNDLTATITLPGMHHEHETLTYGRSLILNAEYTNNSIYVSRRIKDNQPVELWRRHNRGGHRLTGPAQTIYKNLWGREIENTKYSIDGQFCLDFSRLLISPTEENCLDYIVEYKNHKFYITALDVIFYLHNHGMLPLRPEFIENLKAGHNLGVL